VNAALAMHGMSVNAAEDCADLNRLLLFPLRRTGASVLLIDHVTKASEDRGRWATGSQHKLAVLDGAVYAVKALTPPAPGRVGRLRMTLVKDRHGGVQRNTVSAGRDEFAAEVVIDSTGEAPSMTIEPPSEPVEWKPTVIMEMVSRCLEGRDEPLSQRAIVDRVPGKTDYVRMATDQLVAEGYVARSVEGRAHMHASIRPYREAS
jgi:hypothetical protein